MQEEIALLKNENIKLDNDITSLKSFDRVYAIASAAGLSRLDDNNGEE